MTSHRRATLQIHLCVVLWGFTGILGRLISVNALALVWWRMTIVVLALLLLPRVRRGLSQLSGASWRTYAGIGLLVALHWLTFYGAIKLSNASTAASCIALGPIFIAFFEPWLNGRRIDPRELFVGVAVAPGVALVVGGVAPAMRWGLVVGCVSALLVALFGIFNKRVVSDADPMVVTCVELGAGVLLLTTLSAVPGSSLTLVVPTPRDLVLLAVLALACTLVPFVLSLYALRSLSAFAVQLSVNLEPVYTVLLAIPLLREQRELRPSFYLGLVILLGAVVGQSVVDAQRRRAAQALPANAS